ncbi:MAG TPA: YdcF family protein [Candidatus Limnocylindrales bacterium]
MRRALIRLAAATAVGIVVVFAYGAFRIWSQGMQDERRPAGAVVVLGAAQYNGRPSPIYLSRLQHAVELFKTGDYGYLFVTGGKQPGDRTTEAAVGRQYAISQGVPANRILMEDQGRNTLESLDGVRTVLAAKSIRDAVFVSDRSHMLRVLRIASDLGIAAYGSPTPDSPGDSDPAHVVEITFHELGGLAVYFISGQSPPD